MAVRSRLASVAIAGALLGLTACAQNAESTASAPSPSATTDTAYCDSVRELAGHTEQFQSEMVKGAKKADPAKLRRAVHGFVSASTAARDAAPADLPDSWDPVVTMFEEHRDAAEKLDYRLFNRRADRVIEKLPTSDGALDVLSRDAATRCGIKSMS